MTVFLEFTDAELIFGIHLLKSSMGLNGHEYKPQRGLLAEAYNPVVVILVGNAQS